MASQWGFQSKRLYWQQLLFLRQVSEAEEKPHELETPMLQTQLADMKRSGL